MGSSDEDGVTTDPVHVDACARLQVKHVDVAKLRDYVDHVILAGYLNGIGTEEGKWNGSENKIENEPKHSEASMQASTCIVHTHARTHARTHNTHTRTGKSSCAYGEKVISTALFWKGWLPSGGVPTSMICN